MMKISCKLLAAVLTLAVASALAQSQQRLGTGRSSTEPAPTTETNARPVLTKFDLDFPGGTPKELVAAIQKSMGRPLNAIVPDEYADMNLPPLKMTDVDVSELFRALELVSQRTEPVIIGTTTDSQGNVRYTFQQTRTNYGFKTDGVRSDDSVWYFFVDKPAKQPGAPPLRSCRFYALAPYLERGLKVDDITTAIQTGWRMLDPHGTSAEISYHKDTKLLIAVGEPDKLETIDAVLSALDVPKPAPAPPSRVSSPIREGRPVREPNPDE